MTSSIQSSTSSPRPHSGDPFGRRGGSPTHGFVCQVLSCDRRRWWSVAIVGFNLASRSDRARASSEASRPPRLRRHRRRWRRRQPGADRTDERHDRPWPLSMDVAGGDVTFVLPDGWTAGRSRGMVRNQETPTHFELAHYMPGSPDQVTECLRRRVRSGADSNRSTRRWTNLMSAALEIQAGTDRRDFMVNDPDGVTDPPVGRTFEFREQPGLDRSTAADGAEGSVRIWAIRRKRLLRLRHLATGARIRSSARTARAFVFTADPGRTQPRPDV